MTVFKFTEYKAYLRAELAAEPNRRGYQGALARAAGCKSSYLSAVLRGPVHLTPDHAAGLSRFWNFSDLETDYFLALVGHGRAATPLLRSRLERQLTVLRKRWERLDQHLNSARSEMELEHALRYYASWHTPAIHMLLGIPELRTPEKIAERLRLPVETVHAALASLAEMKLVHRSGTEWQRTESDLHLPQNSAMAAMAHAHWRHRSISRFPEIADESLFYSGLHTLSREDFQALRELFTRSLKRAREIVAKSPEEEIVCLTCDLFRL